MRHSPRPQDDPEDPRRRRRAWERSAIGAFGGAALFLGIGEIIAATGGS